MRTEGKPGSVGFPMPPPRSAATNIDGNGAKRWLILLHIIIGSYDPIMRVNNVPLILRIIGVKGYRRCAVVFVEGL
jgi:hypothetical protein